VAFLGGNASGAEDGMSSIIADYPDSTIPVLQDTSKVKGMWNCGASAHNLYVIDGDRNVHYAHYKETAPFSEDGLRLVEEIDSVLGR